MEMSFWSDMQAGAIIAAAGGVVGAVLNNANWFIRIMRPVALHPMLLPGDWRTIEAAMNGESPEPRWFAKFIPSPSE